MLGRTNVSGGNSKVVNGIIEQYRSLNETIDANTFVELATLVNRTNDNLLYQTNMTLNGDNIIQISDNKVFISYITSSDRYGVVVEFLENGVSVGTPLKLVTLNDNYNNFEMIKVDNDKVLATNPSSSGSLRIALYKIEDLTITIVGNLTVSSSTGSILNTKFTLIIDNKVLVTHRKSSSTYDLIGTVVSTLNDTITKGTDTVISSTEGSDVLISAVINESQVYLTQAQSYAEKDFLVSISNLTITIDFTNNVGKLFTPFYNLSRLVSLGNNKVLVIGRVANGQYLMGTVVTISSMGIENSTIADFGLHYNGACGSVFILNSSQILIFHGGKEKGFNVGDNHHYVSCCTIAGNDILINSISEITELSPDFYIKGKYTRIYRQDNDFRYSLLEINDCVKKTVSKIDGITKSKITPTSKGDVWVLNESEVV